MSFRGGTASPEDQQLVTRPCTVRDMTWAYGSTVLYRYGRRGRATFVRTGRVISDNAEGLTLWVGTGWPQIETVLADGRPLRAAPLEDRGRRARVRTAWRGPGIVQHAPATGEWSVSWFFDAAGRFAGWYGNLESPRIRWEHGVDTSDRALDVEISPDRSARWKDEDEFAAMTGTPGRWTAAQAPAIRATGEHLMALAAASSPPFDGRWTDYRPDPAWPAPDLPPTWDLPHQAHP